MGFIQDFFGRILFKGKPEGGNVGHQILSSTTGKPLNHLYNPKPRKEDYDECGKIMDEYMESFGYKKLLMGKDIPRPKRGFLRKDEKLEIGDIKIMGGVTRFKK